MSIRDCINLMMASLVVLSLAGCTGGRTQESFGEYVDSAALGTKIRTAIIKDPLLKLSQIDVKTFKSTVQLSGFVDSQEAADRAVQIARTTKGVKQVQNSLIVKE
ncbi:MAG: BON domain-containing protein [Gammaproteobacteria bacterium]